MDGSTYPIPAMEQETVSGVGQVSLLTHAFTKRKIFLVGAVTSAMLDSFTLQMMTLLEDRKNPISIYINSPGGEVLAGLGIYDQIQTCPAQIDVYCIGLAASMGAVLLAGGPKGHRYILPHSKVMIHEPLIDSGAGGSATSLQRTAESILKTKRQINEILAEHTGKTIKQIDKATDHDNFMTAQEAVTFGICDKVIESLS